jgi:hypothetical protein
MLIMQGLGCAMLGDAVATLLAGVLVLASGSVLAAVKAASWPPAARWKPVPPAFATTGS